MPLKRRKEQLGVALAAGACMTSKYAPQQEDPQSPQKIEHRRRLETDDSGHWLGREMLVQRMPARCIGDNLCIFIVWDGYDSAARPLVEGDLGRYP